MAWRELGEGGRFARALWCFGRRRPPRARGWGVRTAGFPRLRGSVAGGEARGGEGERGDTVLGRFGDATAMPLADQGAQVQGLGRQQRFSSIPIESTMPRCAMRSGTLW